MMEGSFKELNLKKSYSSDEDDILNDFYIPVLKHTVEYNRLAGFFSSTVLAIAARGIIQLIKNKGRMKLIVSPKLSPGDIKTILSSKKDEKKLVEEILISELETLDLENLFVQDHVKALGWMISNGFLEIKIALVRQPSGSLMTFEQINNNALFHQKVGIFKDYAGNILSFSGSVNETKSGWLNHIEEFKVFRKWLSEEGFVNPDIRKFNRFWNNEAKDVTVIELPVAVKAKFIKFSPKTLESLKLGKWHKIRKNEKSIRLYSHQQVAVQKWIANGMRGIFSMATGTGKTFAAIECLSILLEHYKPLCAVIACPNNQLIVQWRNEIRKFSINDTILIADSTNRKWKDKMEEGLIDLHIANTETMLILTTHATLTSEDFNNILNRHHSSRINCLLIGDEVHRLGSPKRGNKLFDGFNFRLGLSATPDRGIFDIEGTKTVLDFFHGIIFKFELGDAITKINPMTGKSYLTPFYYKPVFVELELDEVNDYLELTNRISKICRKNKNEKDILDSESVKNLLFQRSGIIKNAKNKILHLEHVITSLIEEYKNVKWLLIYCTEKQIDTIIPILKKHRLISHKFTMKEGTIPNSKFNGLSERSYILQKFEEGDYHVLVAMKCLDEGIDIPPARITILTASSGSEREYIQRIGRVIRRYPEKKNATIFDLIVIPPIDKLPKQLKHLEQRIMKSEYARFEKIVKNAVNSSEALSKLYELKKKL